MVDSVNENDFESVVCTLQNFISRNSFNNGCDLAVEWVHDEFVSYGLDSVYFHNYSSSYAPNVIGILNGEKNTDTIYIICGHIDATAGSPFTNESVAPGADDNASGSGCVILAAKVMSNYRFRHEVRFICFTGEEQGLVGSSYYASAHSSDNICGVLCFDMVGYADNSPEDLDVMTNSASVWLADVMIASANTYVGLPTFKHVSSSI
jgi:Zn-dependent M28 family amino/carboxypeptidase